MMKHFADWLSWMFFDTRSGRKDSLNKSSEGVKVDLSSNGTARTSADNNDPVYSLLTHELRAELRTLVDNGSRDAEEQSCGTFCVWPVGGANRKGCKAGVRRTGDNIFAYLES